MTPSHVKYVKITPKSSMGLHGDLFYKNCIFPLTFLFGHTDLKCPAAIHCQLISHTLTKQITVIVILMSKAMSSLMLMFEV